MIVITITAQQTGKKALLYELPGRKGRRTYVSTYLSFVHDTQTDDGFSFAVTRDSSMQIFVEKGERHFRKHGECPPSGETPYRGLIREDGPLGFRVELLDPFIDTSVITGKDGTRRSNIQIHFGAAASYGCILVAGRRRLYGRNFADPLRSMLQGGRWLQVVVEPR